MLSLERYPAEAAARRRRRLLAALGSTPALIPAGALRPRNYVGAPYPFRASSHFLYLVGVPLPGAMLLLDEGRATLAVAPPSAADALWHGPEPTLGALGEHVGCSVVALDALPGLLGDREVATLPAPDAETRATQSALLGRPIAAGSLDELDLPLAEAIIAMRLKHDDAAVDGIRRACRVTARAHRAGMGATKAGVDEWHVRAAMERELVAHGMSHAYGPIVTVHGEVLHNDAHHHALGKGDLLLADVGAETHDGWASDVTRTWPVAGRFSSTQRALYEVVLEAQQRAIAAAAPGVRYRELHLLACAVLTEGLVDLGVLRGDPHQLVADGVHALLFPHGLGHLLGLDVHDMEDLGDRAGYAPGRARAAQFGLCYLRLDRDLEPGMVVTIEPGIYLVPSIFDDPALQRLASRHLDRERLAKFSDVRGIRIEDDILITETGSEVLTADIPKDLEDVEAAVGAR